MIHANRSQAAFQELIQNWKGILISDDYGVYRSWAEKKQACLAHLIRRAKGLSERKDKQIKSLWRASPGGPASVMSLGQSLSKT